MKMQEYIKTMHERLMPALENETLTKQYIGWLLEKASGKTATELLIQDIELTALMQEKLERWLDDITYHSKPIAYILQEAPFGDINVTVRPPILIPRPETEEWVYNLISELEKTDTKRLRILDMCTGSGCIALALNKAFPEAQIYAVDISAFALMLVEENKKKLDLSGITCIESDLFTAVPRDLSFDIIVSNPPYITDKEFARLDPSVKNWEDSRALLANDNGLALIERIIAQAPEYLRHNSLLQKHGIAQLYIEIGSKQGQAVQQLMQSSGYKGVHIAKDLARKDRVVSGSIHRVAAAKNQL